MKLPKEATLVQKSADIFKGTDGCYYNEEVVRNGVSSKEYLKYYKLDSKEFRDFAMKIVIDENDSWLSQTEMQNIRDSIVAWNSIIKECPTYPIYLRRGSSIGKDGFSYCFHLGNSYLVIQNKKISIERMRLPLRTFFPTGGEPIETVDLNSSTEDILKLRDFLNPKISNEEFLALVSFIVFSLMGLDAPQVILQLTGQQGCGKTILSNLINTLVDPNISPIRSPPKNEEDLIISANSTIVPIFDNISKLSDFQSDALCRVVTGTSLSTRKMYTNTEESVINAKNSIVINSIVDVLWRSDLRDRSFTIDLPVIEKAYKRSEMEFRDSLNKILPVIRGALFKLVQVVGESFYDYSIETDHRFQEFIKVGEILNETLNLSNLSFDEIITNQKNQKAVESSFDEYLFLLLIHVAIKNGEACDGGVELVSGMSKLFNLLGESTIGDVIWEVRPSDIGRSPGGLGKNLRRRAPQYKLAGLHLSTYRTSSGSMVKAFVEKKLIESFKKIDPKCEPPSLEEFEFDL